MLQGIRCLELRAARRELQGVNTHVVDFKIANVSIDPQWIVGSFERDLDGINRWIIKYRTVLFPNRKSNSWCHELVPLTCTCLWKSRWEPRSSKADRGPLAEISSLFNHEPLSTTTTAAAATTVSRTSFFASRGSKFPQLADDLFRGLFGCGTHR